MSETNTPMPTVDAPLSEATTGLGRSGLAIVEIGTGSERMVAISIVQPNGYCPGVLLDDAAFDQLCALIAPIVAQRAIFELPVGAVAALSTALLQ